MRVLTLTAKPRPELEDAFSSSAELPGDQALPEWAMRPTITMPVYRGRSGGRRVKSSGGE